MKFLSRPLKIHSDISDVRSASPTESTMPELCALSPSSSISLKESSSSSTLFTTNSSSYSNGTITNAAAEDFVDPEEEQVFRDAQIIFDHALSSSPQFHSYQPIRIIGYGTFGIVVECALKVAIKIVSKSRLQPCDLLVDPATSQTHLLEVEMLRRLPQHPNIMGYINHWCDCNFWYIVTEIGGRDWRYHDLKSAYPQQLPVPCPVPTGKQQPHKKSLTSDRTLAGFLRAFGGLTNEEDDCIRSAPVIPERFQRRIFRQVIDAVNALHSAGIAHMDLKDENVLVDEYLGVKIIDFGHSKLFSPTSSGFSRYGTELFSSPETRSGRRAKGPKADVYAVGLMLYEATTGDLPINLLDATDSLESSPFRFDFEAGFLNPLLADLCQWMLMPNPKHRPTLNQVISHPYLLLDSF